MFSDIIKCFLEGEIALGLRTTTKVFGDKGSSGWQLNIKWFRIKKSQQSLRRKCTERKESINSFLSVVKNIQINLNRNMRNKEIHSDAIIQMMTFFLIKI